MFVHDGSASASDHFTVVNGNISSWREGGGRKRPDVTRAKFTDGAAGTRLARKNPASVADAFSAAGETNAAPLVPPRRPASSPFVQDDDNPPLPLEHFTLAGGLAGGPVRTEKAAGGRRRFEGANGQSHDEIQWRPGRRAPSANRAAVHPAAAAASSAAHAQNGGRRAAPAHTLMTQVGAALRDPEPGPAAAAPPVPRAPLQAPPWSSPRADSSGAADEAHTRGGGGAAHRAHRGHGLPSGGNGRSRQ